MKDEQEQQTIIEEMKIIREVKIQAQTFYEEAKALGDFAAEAFGEKHRAQITGLENIAESAFTISEILDYIKRQTARHEHWRKDDFGKKLVEKLEAKTDDKPHGGILDTRQRGISKRLEISEKTEQGKQERRRIHLLLVRQFIRQMVVEYEFQVSFGKGERRDGTD